MTEDATKPELGNTKTDYAVMAGRAVSGLVPFAGSFISGGQARRSCQFAKRRMVRVTRRPTC